MKKKKIDKKKLKKAIEEAFEISINLGYITREQVEKYKISKKINKEKLIKTFKSKTSKYYKSLKNSGLIC